MDSLHVYNDLNTRLISYNIYMFGFLPDEQSLTFNIL